MSRFEAIAKPNYFLSFIHEKDNQMKIKLNDSKNCSSNETTNIHKITIHVKSLFGDYIKINVDPKETVSALKTQICIETGILEKTQSLYFNMVQMENNKELRNYLIENDSIIYMSRDLNDYFTEFQNLHLTS